MISPDGVLNLINEFSNNPKNGIALLDRSTESTKTFYARL